MMKEGRTIAIIGETGKFYPALAEKLVQQNLRLLFVSNDEGKTAQMIEQLENKYPSAEIESIHCEKEGCWEADIVVFTNPENIDGKLVQRIKDVATQKLILILSEKGHQEREAEGNNARFLELLPHSRLVRVRIDPESMEIEIFGKDGEARKIVRDIFKKEAD